MEANCKTKSDEWAVIVQTRSQELLALADTIKVLNDDDALARHLLVNLEKTGFSWNTWFVDPIWQLRGFWRDRNERKNGAQLYGPRVSNFLSHRIVNSLIVMIFGKLEFQCTRNDPQNPPYCPGSLQDTFIIYSSISHQHIFRKYVPWKNLENRTSENLKIQKPRFTNRSPEVGSWTDFWKS